VVALVVLAPTALAEAGDLTGAGCLRDLENTLTGCQSVQGLDRGYGVAVSPDGKQVYVAAADDDTLTTFNRDTQTGAVTWIGCLRDDGRAAVGCTTVAGLDGARGIAVSPDGKSVYVASGDGDALAVFDRNTTSGALTSAGCFRDTENPLAGCTQVQGLDAPRDVSITADGTSVYEASANDDAITYFRRATSGALTWVSCVRDVSNAGTGCASAIGIDGPRAADLSPDGTSLYVAARDGDSVAEFDRNTTTGALTWRGCFRDVENTITGCTSVQGLDGPHGISLSPDGTSVYFPTESDDTVTTFARNTTSGALTYGGCIGDIGVAPPGCASAEGLNGARQATVSADGTSVYVAGADDDAVVVFDRDSATGALTWDSCTRDADRPSANQCALAQGLDGARGLASSEDGTSVYAVSELDDALVVFNRETAASPPPPDTTAPTVAWKTPAEGQLVWGTLTEANGGCTITAADDRVLDRVEFLLDGAPLSTDTTAPYGCDWDTTTTPNGSHTLTATAVDAAGNRTQVARSVTVDQPPAVQLTSPVAGSTFRKSLSFAATASDDLGVARVEFYVDGSLKATDTTAPYSATWQAPGNFPNGSHFVTAKAIDVRGLSATSSVTVTRK
jgi:DNA-binding beta-propeller fold protein YncE